MTDETTGHRILEIVLLSLKRYDARKNGSACHLALLVLLDDTWSDLFTSRCQYPRPKTRHRLHVFLFPHVCSCVCSCACCSQMVNQGAG